MPPDKSPAFQWYPKDFLTDEKVILMSNTERGIYITFLSQCWLEGTLPLETASLAHFARMSLRQFTRLWEHSVVRTCFYVNEDGRLHHKRLDEEREKQDRYKRRQSDAATMRWDKLANATALPVRVPVAVPPQCSSSSSSSPSPEKKKKDSPPKEPADPRVKAFLDWFPEEYKARRFGAVFLVVHKRDGALVKDMLAALEPGPPGLALLQTFSKIMLSEKCEDEFIQRSDRGIGVLKTKFNWLSERYAAWQASSQQARV